MGRYDWTPSDAADAADAERDRNWWRRPDPFDPQNQSDADATPHCGKTFDCYRSTDSGTKPSWRQSWASFPGGPDCPDFWDAKARRPIAKAKRDA